MEEPPSSPPTEHASPEAALRYYKAQYEQLENELAEFQASSQELEAELEKDVEAAEKRERLLQEKVESLSFEVEEWKTKYKQAKTEAGAAQNTLQKEITTLRDSNRTLQMKLRDIEVANDDFERQARNTTSSLENLESKYNMAIERGVMMEEEIKLGEQERENLRIETQRLRDELSDLKIEAEIMQDKLKKQSARSLPTISTDITAPNSPEMARSPDSVASSPLISTPPGADTKSVSTADTVSETPTPPSPPVSERSTKAPTQLRTPMNPPPSRIRMPSGGDSATPKPSRLGSVARPLGGRPSISGSAIRGTPSVSRNVSNKAGPARGLPNSASLTHIRSLTAQMQRLEQRVQSARSKLPAPVGTPPSRSPRGGTALGGSNMPSSVTIRSRKRTVGSTASSITADENNGTPTMSRHVPRLSTSGISRLSFGPVTSHNRDASESASRPSSRASNSSFALGRPTSRSELRPSSRASMTGGGARTPLGHYSQSSFTESRRPRSSVGGQYAHHGHSQSVSHIDMDETREVEFGTPSRRSTLGRDGLEAGSAIPAPKGLGRRQSGQMTPGLRRTSGGVGAGAETGMKPPPPGRVRKLSGVGETY